MDLSDCIDGIIGEMIALKQTLRKTAPEHRLSEDDLKRFRESVNKAEEMLKSIKKELGEGST
ncbi:MAG: hypothetical protein QFX35_05350 [Candidatus Verstraetearchaeota archaeon]|nr:hypothetical protein [Candidatus Verstraetearchaeota archaeon]